MGRFLKEQLIVSTWRIVNFGDISKVKITTDISNSINQYVEEPDGSYRKRY